VKKTVKIVGIVLAIVMLMSMGASAAFVRNIVNGDSAATALGQGKRRAADMKESDIMAQVIVVPATKRLDKVELCCASWGNAIGDLTVTIYAWNETYDKSIFTKVLATKTFNNFADNARLILYINPDKNISGKLLVTVSNATEKVGPWYYDGSASSSYPFFINGEELPGGFDGSFYTSTVSEAPNKATVAKRSAFDTIPMGEFDTGFGVDKRARSVNKEKQLVASISHGSYAGYYAVDFGNEGAKGVEFKVRIMGLDYDNAQIQVVLDDPARGPVIAECLLEYHEYEDFVETVSCEITEKVTGVHDVYVTFTDEGYMPEEMVFTKDKPVEDYYAKRLREFNETKDFTLKSTYSDTWTATDMLGRKVADFAEAGEYNPDKQVGMFYWTWHANKERITLPSFSNNQEVLDTYNGDIKDIKNNYNYPKWGSLGFWNESVYGHYHGLDGWVMRKHMELLAATGVDGLFFDATNGSVTWVGGYMKLGQVMHDMHRDGIQTPGMAFMLPFSDNENTMLSLEKIYEHMYSKGLYSDCWYYFKGKPAVMAYYGMTGMETAFSDVNKQHREILDFFTFRPPQASYFDGPQRDDHWPWLEVYPQHPYGKSKKYGCEAVSVGVAQNAGDIGLVAMNGYDVYGRSYTYKDRFSRLSDTSKYYGYNFQEQWDRAFQLNPEFVFVTGWNEWTAGHHEMWGADEATGAYPDTFSDEYSRDIEPTKGDFKDTYYYQLVDNVRKFKGVRPTPEASGEKTISLEGDFAQWKDVGPEFIGFKGGTDPRNARKQSTGNIKAYYTNNTGRNDIVLSKVARDKDNVYFYVETAEHLTPYTGDSWMRLFINTDRTFKTGWEGYDFALNIEKATADKLILSETAAGWNWKKTAEVDYTLEGNKMMVAIPRKALGIEEFVDVEFKWNDNMQEQGDIMDFYTNGDTAPIGRFSYHYTEDASKAKKPTDEHVEPCKTDKDILRYSVIMKIGESKAFVRNEETRIDENNSDVHPMIVRGKTMVPIRFLTENLGAYIVWEEKTQTAKITLNDKRINITVGSDIMEVEKEKHKLQSPAFEQNGRIYIPLRDVVEMSGEACVWLEPDIIVVRGKAAEITTRETLTESINKMFE